MHGHILSGQGMWDSLYQIAIVLGRGKEFLKEVTFNLSMFGIDNSI